MKKAFCLIFSEWDDMAFLKHFINEGILLQSNHVRAWKKEKKKWKKLDWSLHRCRCGKVYLKLRERLHTCLLNYHLLQVQTIVTGQSFIPSSKLRYHSKLSSKNSSRIKYGYFSRALSTAHVGLSYDGLLPLRAVALPPSWCAGGHSW